MRLAVIIVAMFAGTAPAWAAPSADELCAMVTDSKELKIVYVDDPAGSEPRVFDLYGVGTTSADNLVVFGMQTSGYAPTTDAGDPTIPGWRTFRVDRLTTIEDAGKTFAVAVPPPNALRLVAKWSCASPIVPVAK